MATSTTAIAQNTAYPATKEPDLVGKSASSRLLKLRMLEVCLDLATAFFAIEATYYIAHFSSLHMSAGSLPKHLHLVAVFLSAILAALLERAGAYRLDRGLLGIRETACVLEAIFYAMLILVPYMLFSGASGAFAPGLVAATLLALFLVIQKQSYGAILWRMRTLRADFDRVVVYGQPESATSVLEVLLRSPKSSFLPIACFSDMRGTDYERTLRRKAPQVVFYDEDQFSETLLRGGKIDFVVIASPISSSERLKFVLKQCELAESRILFGVEPQAMGTIGIEYFELDGQLLYGVYAAGKRSLYDALKRIFDCVVAAALLLLAAVPMAFAAIAISLDTRGGILFRQTRIGLHGKPFTILKFRTMHVDMCGYKASPLDSSDPRITRVGKWLRKSSIDELPQLFNILRGEMALVGPRPEMPFIVATYSATQMQRLSVKPGLTGIWQISADRRYPIHENIHYDLYYLKHRSVFIDLALMLHTVLLTVKGI